MVENGVSQKRNFNFLEPDVDLAAFFDENVEIPEEECNSDDDDPDYVETSHKFNYGKRVDGPWVKLQKIICFKNCFYLKLVFLQLFFAENIFLVAGVRLCRAHKQRVTARHASWR
jgi:hypothetical protein